MGLNQPLARPIADQEVPLWLVGDFLKLLHWCAGRRAPAHPSVEQFKEAPLPPPPAHMYITKPISLTANHGHVPGPAAAVLPKTKTWFGLACRLK